MKDIVIIGVFFATRLSRPVQEFVAKFLEETQTHIVLNSVFILMTIVIIVQTKKSKKNIKNIGGNNENFREYFIGLRCLTIVDVVIALGISLILLGINTPPTLLESAATDIAISTSSFLLGITLIVLASFTEELFYRSYIMMQLKRIKFNIPFALIFSAILFMLGHTSYGIDGMVFSFSAGIILSLLMVLRQSLWANTIAHCAYNITIYSLTFF